MLSKFLITLLPVLACAAPYGYGPGSGSGGDGNGGSGGNGGDGSNGGSPSEPKTVSATIDFEEYASLLGLRDADLTAQGICANNISPIGPLIPELQISGVKPHGDEFGVFGPIRNILNGGKPAITALKEDCPNAVTEVFDLESLCFGCALPVVVADVLTGLPKKCELTLQGYDKDGKKTDVAGPFDFTPKGLNNDLVCVDVALKSVSKVVPKVDAGILGLVVSGIIDDIKFSYTKED